MNQTAGKDEYDDHRSELERTCNPLFEKMHTQAGASAGTLVCRFLDRVSPT